MKPRTLILTLLLVGFFWFATSRGDWNIQKVMRPLGIRQRLWSEPVVAHGAGIFSNDEQNNIDIYHSNRMATVNITSVVYQQDFFFRLFPQKGTGSGFIINEDGQIVTNNHVISGSREITVTLAGQKKQFRAKVLGIDTRNDLALLQIRSDQKLPIVHLGDSGNLQVGQKVLAIGNPFGLEGTLTTGIISSLDRSLEGESGRLEGLIQTDAAINPGNSGGPLLDSHGNVIGINTAIMGSQTASGEAGSIGIGFAMPINRAKARLEEYRTSGKISRAVIGLNTVFVQGDLADALRLPVSGGLLIEGVEQGSAAEEAGLRGPSRMVIVGGYQLGIGGDLIVAIDGKPVASQDALQAAMTAKRGGDKMELTVFRGNRNQRVTVTLGSAPQTL